jgi:glucokinase
LGGTTVKGVLIDAEGNILQKHCISDGENNDVNWEEKVLKVVDLLRPNTGESVKIIGLSSPGLANESNTAIAHLPGRLPGLENFGWTNSLGIKTHVLNDAHAALKAEASFGALREYKNAILITLGTGLGGGILLNGELYQGLSQMAGHMGHSSINFSDDETSLLGIPGSIEYAIGNFSISRRSKGKFQSTHELLQAYERKEPFATWLWLDSLRKFAIYLASLINIFSPEAIVLSGGITLAGDQLFNPLQEFMDLYEFRPKGKKTSILKAHFEDFSGAIGAAAFALDKMKQEL